jgi:uncharacterized membrane protein YgcG
MGRAVVVAVLALTGLLCAAGIGVAAYVVSRDSVAVPVTRLQPKPSRTLTPATVRQTGRTTSTATTKTTPTTTVDDHGGNSGSGGGGGDNSGHGGGDHGGDD